MTRDVSPVAAAGPARIDAAQAADCHERSGAAQWGVSVASFHAALERSATKRFAAEVEATTIDGFLDGLHLDDLALAVACAGGDEEAWRAFDRRHLPDLRRAAAAIAGETEGQEIVDALTVDLFARGAASPDRRSLFEYFHGRSRLGTWLRALVSQRHVDRLRATRRLTPLEDLPQSGERFASAPAPDPDRQRLVAALLQALDAAIGALLPRDRLRLAYYHVDGLTLAAIGRRLGEHEATVSRKLQRTRDALRAQADAELTTTLGLGPEELRECYAHAIEDGGLDLGRLRLVEPPRER